MKRHILLNRAVRLTLVAVGCVFAVVGCGEKRTDELYVRVDKIHRVESCVRETDGAPLKMEADVELPVDPGLRKGVNALLGKTLERVLRAPVEESGIDGAFRAFRKEFEAANWKGGWQLKLTGGVVWFSESVMSYQAASFTFCSGVHPDRRCVNASFDRRTGRRITVSDLFEPASYLKVLKALRRRMAEDESIGESIREDCARDIRYSPEECIAVSKWGDPRLTENFIIVRDGLIWTYNEYEIASYMEGMTEAFVPFTDLEGLFKPFAPIPPPERLGTWDAAVRRTAEEGSAMEVGSAVFLEVKESDGK